MKKESIEKLDQIVRKIHKCIDEAYKENLDANCEPKNDEISGNLAHAKDLLERYFIQSLLVSPRNGGERRMDSGDSQEPLQNGSAADNIGSVEQVKGKA